MNPTRLLSNFDIWNINPDIIYNSPWKNELSFEVVVEVYTGYFSRLSCKNSITTFL